MIMSSSCDYLLREYLGVGVDGALERRLVAYLDLKLKLGMAEFLSPVCRYAASVEGKGKAIEQDTPMEGRTYHAERGAAVIPLLPAGVSFRDSGDV
jgi:hypothetical protein